MRVKNNNILKIILEQLTSGDFAESLCEYALGTQSTDSKSVVHVLAESNDDEMLSSLIDVLGEKRFVYVCRELTKIHEETIRGTLSSLLHLQSERKLKGECVLLIGKDDKNVYFE